MKSAEIRTRFLKFFEKRGHTIIPSASLVPENDPSVLFNTAGMQPLVPYLLGEKHPAGTRIVDAQKCVRTNDIDEVGDNTHLTFFEMLGNWSLGDYFKEDAIHWSFEFLTSKEEGLGLDPSRLYVTVFEGDENAPRDEEAFEIWKEIFEKIGLDSEKRIFFMPAKNNWWSPGDNGPCGPDTEMFYDVTGTLTEGMTKEQFLEADDKQHIVEIWNDVFMEYEKRDGKVVGKLAKKNVDTGSGLERVTTMVQGKTNVFETDLFSSIIEEINSKSKIQNSKQVQNLNNQNTKSVRIIADHIRTAVFLISDGVIPSNTDAGYILRRIIRRAVRHMDILGIEAGSMVDLASVVIEQYGVVYGNIKDNAVQIREEVKKEEDKFRKTLKDGLKQFEKISDKNISGKDAFVLFSSYGFPIEMTQEIAKEKSLQIDMAGFEEEMKKHQELSRTASAGKFKGGLGGHDENSTKLHTATHLLLASLREILGNEIYQKGSNITPERLRFDFNYSEKLTDEQIKKIEDLVNQKIKENIPVEMKEMPKEEALKIAKVSFDPAKYGDIVKVYKIGDFSAELCGGPHVENTSELGYFKIKKEEASSAGVRRIKAILK